MKLVIADDHALFSDTLSQYILRKYPDAAIRLTDSLHGVLSALTEDSVQDLVLMDLRMPGMDSGKGFSILKARFPNVRLALMSGLAEPADVRLALQDGACGYFPKTMHGKEFLIGIEQILSGKIFVPVDIETNMIMQAYKSDTPQTLSKTQNAINRGLEYDGQASFVTAADIHLSPRENDVLVHLLRGDSNKAIANRLSIQEVTVKLHIRGICQKLGVTNRTQAALKARELGLG